MLSLNTGRCNLQLQHAVNDAELTMAMIDKISRIQAFERGKVSRRDRIRDHE